MKKSLFILSGILIPLASFAEANEPVLEPGMYAIKVSPNGQYLCNFAGDAGIYNVSTGETVYYPETSFGIGNTIANNGMAVAAVNDKAALLYNGEILRPTAYNDYWFCDFNGITPDGTKVIGIINNTKAGPTYLPFIADVDANGNVSAPQILPYPAKDFFDATPQFISAVWISDDGKTIGGQVSDSMGYFDYPIVFKQAANGDWSYYLPTEKIFNPDGIKIPENPWENEPVFPEPENFMSGALLLAYQEAYQAYLDGELKDMPIPEEYMTDEQFERYEAAVNKYNDWYYGEQTAMKEYLDVYYKVLATSPTFSINDFALQPDGSVMVQHGGMLEEIEDGLYEMIGKLYVFDTKAETFKIIDGPDPSAAPKQILPDGTLIISRGVREVPTSWVLRPGAAEFQTMEEYLAPKYPELAKYLGDNFANGSGIVSASYDMSVWCGGMTVECLSDYSEDLDADAFYYTYVLTNLDLAGVESLVSEATDGIYKVYNLKGVKVLETKDACELYNLEKGIYIVNGKKYIIK